MKTTRLTLLIAITVIAHTGLTMGVAHAEEDAIAQNNIGLIYANGYSVTKDNEKAVRWFKKAARQGNKAAIKSLKKLGMTN